MAESFPGLSIVAETKILDKYCLSCPLPVQRSAIEQSLATCVTVFEADLTYSSLTELTESDVEWHPAAEYFGSVEGVQGLLMSHLCCDCDVQHQALVSFSLPCRLRQGESAQPVARCCTCFQGQEGAWHQAEVQVDLAAKERRARFQDASIHDRPEPLLWQSLGSFCQRFSNTSESLILVAKQNRLLELTPQSNTFQTSPTDMISLRDWIMRGGSSFLTNTNEIDRLALAILMAYAYLHLSGSVWWPDHKLEPDIWFSGGPSPESRFLRQPFLTLDLPSQFAEGAVEDKVDALINGKRPSLPAFGKMLLEIWTGR